MHIEDLINIITAFPGWVLAGVETVYTWTGTHVWSPAGSTIAGILVASIIALVVLRVRKLHRKPAHARRAGSYRTPAQRTPRDDGERVL